MAVNWGPIENVAGKIQAQAFRQRELDRRYRERGLERNARLGQYNRQFSLAQAGRDIQQKSFDLDKLKHTNAEQRQGIKDRAEFMAVTALNVKRRPKLARSGMLPGILAEAADSGG